MPPLSSKYRFVAIDMPFRYQRYAVSRIEKRRFANQKGFNGADTR